MLQLLCLLCLCLAQQARSTSVHEVSISVRSVKSIVYRGVQVSIFEHTNIPKRYFFQPLSFLDASSARLTENSERNKTQLHVDVLLWTDEFIQLVESHFTDHKSVEMLPLTEISLTWSKQANTWLGEDYKKTYSLLDDWKDGDKPHMRSTFTIFCNRREDCEKLLEKFNKSEESVNHLFDLRYKIQCDNSRIFSLSVRSAHFSQSAAFQQLEKFVSHRPGDGRVIVSQQTLDELADQVYTAARVELEQNNKQQFTYVDGESRRAVLTYLHRYLGSDPVHSLSAMQWESQVSWPIDRLNLRPDKLSNMFNILFTSATEPLFVQVTSISHLQEVRESLPTVEFNKVDTFFRRFLPRRPSDPKPPIPVDEVHELSNSLHSPVAWNASVKRFNPATTSLMFRVDTMRVKREGTLMIRDILVFFKESAHRDQVIVMPLNDPATNTDCRAKIERLESKLQRLSNTFPLMEANLSRLSTELDSWISVFAPHGRGRPSSVSTRSSSGGVEFNLGPDESSDITNLRKSLIALEGQIAAMASNHTGAIQPKFADSFCILANRENPPGMTCQVLSMIIPKKSLRHGPLFNKRVRYQEGHIGQSHLSELNSDYLNLSLKICCTA